MNMRRNHANIHAAGLPKRQSIRLKNYDYSNPGYYFVTICTQNTLHLFGEIVGPKMVLNAAGEMVTKWYYELENKYPDKKCHELIIMPNHCHFIIENTMVAVGADLCVCPNCIRPDNVGARRVGGGDQRQTGTAGTNQSGACRTTGAHIGAPLHTTVQWFKTMTTNGYIRGVKQNGWRRFDKKLWQRNYWEHVIRNDNEYCQIAQYIVDNPQQWKLDKLNGGTGNKVMEAQIPYNEEIWMV